MKADSSGFSLHEMLFLAGMRLRTGELVLEAGNNIGTILFHKGKIFQAFSPYSRAIGDLLVEDGLLSETELIETLKFQKKSDYSPLGGLLLKTGKITFEVVEIMVMEQIRQSVKEFLSWKDPNFTFTDKDIHPYDRIHLPAHEFINPEILQSAASFLSLETPQRERSAPATTSSLA